MFRYDGAAINVNCAVDLVCEKDVAGMGSWSAESTTV